jgi:hypothetical protein
MDTHLNPTTSIKSLLKHSQCKLSPHSQLPIPNSPKSPSCQPRKNQLHFTYEHKNRQRTDLKLYPPPPPTITTRTNKLNNAFFHKMDNILILLHAVYAKAISLVFGVVMIRCMPKDFISRAVRVSTHRKNSGRACLRAFAYQAYGENTRLVAKSLRQRTPENVFPTRSPPACPTKTGNGHTSMNATGKTPYHKAFSYNKKRRNKHENEKTIFNDSFGIGSHYHTRNS